MATFNNLVAQIKSIIEAQSTKVRAGNVYDAPVTGITGYPAIRIYPAEVSGSFSDVARNRRSYYIIIQVLQERGEMGEQEAEQVMRSLVDELIAIFDARANLSLNNACQFARPIPGKWGFDNPEQPDVRVANILIECIDIV